MTAKYDKQHCLLWMRKC